MTDNNYPQKNLIPDINFETFNKLEKKLDEITSPFKISIYSILPPKRQIDSEKIFDDIDALYDRFSSWEGTISKKLIQNWLNQFETTLDKNIAYLLLNKFQFFSKNDTESATLTLYEKLINTLKEKDNLRILFDQDAKANVKTEAEMEKWLRHRVIRYTRFPSPPKTSVESQDRLWGLYERIVLTETSCPDGRKFDSLESHFKKANLETDVFVFMDYTNGSGNQLKKCIGEINKLLDQYPEYKQSFFVFLYIVQSELFSFDNINAPINSKTIFYEKMFYYKDAKIMQLLENHEITETEYDTFIKKYCSRSSGKAETGYHQSGSLTCHYYSCPNNTLPFFHEDKNNWIPLFPNSQTPSATRYKTK